MIQESLIDVQIIRYVNATSDFKGADLKVLALGSDGLEYACKRMEDAPAMPISEWVGYCLWRACGLFTPEFRVLMPLDPALPPAFGSRIDRSAMRLPSTGPHDIGTYFGKHRTSLGLHYSLDAFICNEDRHGKNFLSVEGAVGAKLLSIDYSRSCFCLGLPFGNEKHMHDECHTRQWWRFFRDSMQTSPDRTTLERVSLLPDTWLFDTITSAPAVWSNMLDLAAVDHFWKHQRAARLDFAAHWIDE